MALRIIEENFVEEFAERCYAELPYEVDVDWLPRRLYLYTEIGIRKTWMQETVCETVLTILPQTQAGILQALPETVVEALRGTLTGTLNGTPRYLKFYEKQHFSGRGDRHLVLIYLDKVIALSHKAIKQGKRAFIVHRIFDERRSGNQFVSVRWIQTMMGFIDSCSTREALDIKATLERLHLIHTNGKERTHGSEIIAPVR